MDAAIRKHIEDHLPEYLEDLKRLCAQPSVAAQNDGVQECADLVKGMLEEAGLQAQHPAHGRSALPRSLR